MSEVSNEDNPAVTPRDPRPARHTRRDIHLPDGRILTPRANLAAEAGICDATLRRMNPPTTYLGCVAYVDRDGTLQLIGDTVSRPNQPPKPKRRSARRSTPHREKAAADLHKWRER